MFGGSQKGFDLQILFNRLEDQLDLLPCYIYGRNYSSGQMQCIGPGHIVVVGLRVTVFPRLRPSG
jgi:hypothetical protein